MTHFITLISVHSIIPINGLNSKYEVDHCYLITTLKNINNQKFKR